MERKQLLTTKDRAVGKYMKWIDARKTPPPPSEWPTRYLVILDTESPAQHCKEWAGRGEPEIAAFCSQWTPYPWSTRGSLSVAYWMPLPTFTKTWDKTVDGKPGRWLAERATSNRP